MIARLFLLFALAFAVFFGVYWAAFRTRYFTSGRIAELVKRTSLAFAATVSATVVVSILIIADKIL